FLKNRPQYSGRSFDNPNGRLFMRLLLHVFCAALLLSTPLLAQPLADRVPADAIIYVGWRGGGQLRPQYDGADPPAGLQTPACPAAWEKLRPQIISKITEDNAEQAGQFNDMFTVLAMLRKHPTAIFFSGVDLNADDPMPKEALICQAGADAASMMEILNKAAAE